MYQTIKEAAPTEAVDVATAVAFIKEHARTSFDETIELHVRLGIDPQQSNQLVRGSVMLPSGAPKQKRIAVFTTDPKMQAAATEAGAALVGGEELVAQIQETKKLDAEVTIASPDMMPKIAKVAQILGPQGLMPNPKTGTVTPDPAAAVRELAGGKLSFRMDQQGNIHEAIGKASWDAEKITMNVEALLDAIKAARPAAARGQFLRSVTVSSTMGPGVHVTA